ncbi:hypothetical protein GWK47_031028 [Chionoecetes opilio]|uniref:Uncharacterized protein n=1 Tax=Chionoecetes opilio TaxID=41210 RepID=A0A8J4YL93_CHIOP|nr:hypothetical protein GWK47_031028 [Chionoecetes opilio]
MHFNAAELGTSLVIITAEIQTSWSCVWHVPQDPIHLFQKVRDEEPTDSWRSPTEAYTGGTCDSMIGMHAFTAVATVQSFVLAGKMTTLKAGEDGQDLTRMRSIQHLGRSWEVFLNSFRSYKEITCQHVPASTHKTEVNNLSYELFCASTWRWSQVTPHCEDAVCMHALRVKLPGCDLEENLAEPAICCEPKSLRLDTDEDGKLAVN